MFILRTVEGFPGRLTVKRVSDGRVYEANASFGLYEDRNDRAATLLKAFDAQLLAYGKRRRLAP
jgi:hypothetical protein